MEALHSVRTKLILAVRYFPILLVAFVAFLAGAFSNVAIVSLLLGQVVIVPVVTFFIRLLPLPFHVPWSDVGNLFPSHPTQITHTSQPTITTYWMGQTVFFFTYVFLNALGIYSMPSDPNASDWMVNNRKTKLITVLGVLCAVFLGLVYLRYTTTGVESIIGIVVALGVFIPLAYWWYNFATRCGLNHGDMFGIVTQIVPNSADENTPMTCVYAPQP